MNNTNFNQDTDRLKDCVICTFQHHVLLFILKIIFKAKLFRIRISH